ncbi:hypothetical protein BLS_008270 [Venturia inaequalis]|uniref:Glycoside hydrolase family 71 protein n=1 Tax=Venturia inaequalis TaxID=5025 RepID=A0A8H3YNG0_VENIN|nr:hypothetical protein BLS_008270 [Venturia inaequalis]
MVGSVTEAHAHQDIDDAVAMGLDGFVLNTGDPKPYYVKNNFDYMFNYTRDKYGGKFWLFLSIDIQTPGLTNEYTDIFREFKDHDAYYKGPNGRSFLSTFDSKALTNVHWQSFLNKFANSTYFVPDFDDTLGYYEASIGWWKYWGSIVDGLFSWESAWPPAVSGLGGAYPGDIGLDKIVQDGATARGKTYMIALSPLQYKNSYGNNYYRPGDLNLPRRMAGILGMSPSPDFVEIITWNDGPESHYIGTIWPEPNDNKQAAVYTPPGLAAPHTAWQPLITSFINAFKSNLSATAMTPATGDAVGALWYKPIMQNTKCANESLGGFYAKPAGFNKTTDQLNWAIVLPPGAEGYTRRHGIRKKYDHRKFVATYSTLIKPFSKACLVISLTHSPALRAHRADLTMSPTQELFGGAIAQEPEVETDQSKRTSESVAPVSSRTTANAKTSTTPQHQP